MVQKGVVVGVNRTSYEESPSREPHFVLPLHSPHRLLRGLVTKNSPY